MPAASRSSPRSSRFSWTTLKVNLVDTPGHTDFVAEVERSLRVLDGVVLVVSAVEGVQSQTRRLARAMRAANLPLLIFVNKIDRLGARGEHLLDDIRRKLKLRVVAMNACTGSATAARRQHRAIAQPGLARIGDRPPGGDERAGDRGVRPQRRRTGAIASWRRNCGRRSRLAKSCRSTSARRSPASACLSCSAGVEEWLPPATEAPDAPAGGTVFKIDRRRIGREDRLCAALRRQAGGAGARAILPPQHAFGEPEQIEERITGIDRFASGGPCRRTAASAGDIVGLHGLRAARIGDSHRRGRRREPGTLRTPSRRPHWKASCGRSSRDRSRGLRAALEQLAEQDPLISLRQRNDAGELSVRLYGEVQKEVVLDTLAREYGLDVTFGPSQTICIERPIGIGEQLEMIGQHGNPFFATVGLRVEPAAPGAAFAIVRELGALPLAFYRAIEETVHETLRQGLYGWEVTDCVVTLTQCGIVPDSTAGDFRKLTPLVLMQALHLAGTEVCEPIEELELEDSGGYVRRGLRRAGERPRDDPHRVAGRRVAPHHLRDPDRGTARRWSSSCRG